MNSMKDVLLSTLEIMRKWAIERSDTVALSEITTIRCVLIASKPCSICRELTSESIDGEYAHYTCRDAQSEVDMPYPETEGDE